MNAADLLNRGVLEARRRQHKRNVDAALAAAKTGEVINLTALMIGAEQTGAELFGGDAVVSNAHPLASNDWKVKEGGGS